MLWRFYNPRKQMVQHIYRQIRGMQKHFKVKERSKSPSSSLQGSCAFCLAQDLPHQSPSPRMGCSALEPGMQLWGVLTGYIWHTDSKGMSELQEYPDYSIWEGKKKKKKETLNQQINSSKALWQQLKALLSPVLDRLTTFVPWKV